MSYDFEDLEKKAKDIFEDMYKKFDSRVKDLSSQIKETIIPKTEKKLQKNVFQSIIISFGAGFIIGSLLTLFGFFGKKRK